MSNEQGPAEPEIQLFAKQTKVYPRLVTGLYRRRKWLVMYLVLAVYYFAPFLRYDRGPYLPDQAILLDMANRRGYFFFIEIWPQEVYYLTGILVLSAIMLFFVTSLFGRVWCGYLCFQTIWTDLFVAVERLFQGDRAERIKLDQSPLSLNKIWRKLATHLGWLLVSFLTGGIFVMYFNDTPTLLRDLIYGQGVSMNVAGFALGLTFSTYLMAGFAREQVCTFMCPYARFQSAMFDEDSLVIAYDAKRGEPRAKHKKGESWDDRGHCIDCTQCVQVCPTGIDIRDGLQIQCIACGLCVDACNNVMEKLELPKGLIRYDTDRNMRAEKIHTAVSKPEHLRLIRPRTIYYTIVLTLVASVVFFNLLTRATLDINIIHARNPLYVQLSDGAIRNRYDLHVLNKSWDLQKFTISVSGIDGAKLDLRGTGEESLKEVMVEADSVGHFRAFVTLPRHTQEGERKLYFTVTRLSDGVTATDDSFFVSEGAR